MLMNQILDSSPLRAPDEPSRSLKRSASVASLPTPPRTHHKRTKRQKQEETVAQVDETKEISPPPFTRVKAPVSPPPSRRRPLVHSSVERDAPVTPPRRLRLRGSLPVVDAFKTPTKSKVTKILPRRDSPNNPFLAGSSERIKVRSEWDSSDEEEEVVGEAPVREPTPTPTYEEKPTITYVLYVLHIYARLVTLNTFALSRGQKATFHNPLYALAPEVIAASQLPIDHPDYEAVEACPPKRLFLPVGKRKSRDRSRDSPSSLGVKRAKVQSDDDHDESSRCEKAGAATESHKVEAVDSAREERERRETVAKSTLAHKDGLRAGAIVTERDEPARRAMGPPRST